MSGADLLDLARDTIWTVLLLCAPMMVVGLVIGVAISLLQTITQIQEASLSFIPKILAMFVTLLLSLPFMGDVLQSYMARIAERIISSG